MTGTTTYPEPRTLAANLEKTTKCPRRVSPRARNAANPAAGQTRPVPTGAKSRGRASAVVRRCPVRELDAGTHEAFLVERAALRTILPRARVEQDVDGTAIVTAKAARHSRSHLYVQAAGRLVALSYIGRPAFYLARLAGLVERHQAGDGEGVLHLRWCSQLAEALPWFSRRAGHRLGKVFQRDEKATFATVEPRAVVQPPRVALETT